MTLILWSLLMTLPSHAETWTAGPSPTVLVELYTSEGCSSCPPADAYFASLSGKPGLWKDFVPAAFHVDYWDRLGWPDKLASPLHTARQQAYAAAWGSRSVYTPGFVLDGSERRGAPDSLAASRGQAGVLRVTGRGFERSVVYEPAPGERGPFTLHAALLGCGIVSPVTAGENEGKTLHHDFAVLDYSVRALPGGGAKVELKRKGIKAPREAAAFWVTAKDSVVPLQAAGGWLRGDKP